MALYKSHRAVQKPNLAATSCHNDDKGGQNIVRAENVFTTPYGRLHFVDWPAGSLLGVLANS